MARKTTKAILAWRWWRLHHVTEQVWRDAETGELVEPPPRQRTRSISLEQLRRELGEEEVQRIGVGEVLGPRVAGEKWAEKAGIPIPDPKEGKVVAEARTSWWLKSITAEVVWPGPVLEAHEKPSLVHGFSHVGVHCLRLEEFDDQTRRGEWRPYDGAWAIGLVELTGRVVVHRRGYRAQRATLRRLAVPASLQASLGYYAMEGGYDRLETESLNPDLDEQREQLEARYHCDVDVYHVGQPRGGLEWPELPPYRHKDPAADGIKVW